MGVLAISLAAVGGGPDMSMPPNASMAPPPPPPLWTPEQLALLPHDNAGPRLNAAVWSLLGVSTIFLSLRLYCKFLRHRGLWWDDYILIASWVCITIESCLLSLLVSLGYGTHAWDFTIEYFPTFMYTIKIVNVAGTFSVVAAVWSKTSFAFTLLRLTEGWMKTVVWIIIISMNIAMGLSALFIWTQCNPVQKSWDPFVDGTCWSPTVLVSYDIFSAAFSGAMDLTLALLPWKLIWGLQMKKKEKFGVAIAMSCGVFAGITAIIKTTKIPSMLSMDPYDGVDLFIWGNAESCITIIAASIPILRVLIREVRTSARKYYVSGGEEAGTGGKRSKIQSLTANTIVVTAGRSRGPNDSNTDGWSDKSILQRQPSEGKIVRTNEVAVEYEERKDGDSMDYEMNRLPPV